MKSRKAQASNTLRRCREIYTLQLSNVAHERKMSKTVVSIIKKIECSYAVPYVKVLQKLKSDPEIYRGTRTTEPPISLSKWYRYTLI